MKKKLTRWTEIKIISQPSNLGSSETIREASSNNFQIQFSFVKFYKHISMDNTPSKKFLEWFIGFFEGEGSWIHRFDNRSKPNRKELYISLGQKEKNILKIIQKTFDFGTIVKKNNSQNKSYWYWCVYSKKDLETLAILFHGNLVLPKRQNQFFKWVKLGQTIKMFDQLPILESCCDTHKVSLKNGWLSGFIDAEGCFYAKIRKSKKDLSKIGIEQKLHLVQQDVTGYEKLIFEKILTLMKSKSKVHTFSRVRMANSIYIQISIASIDSQKRLIDYLFFYKLRTIKKSSFFKWYILYLYRTNNLMISNYSSKQLIDKMTQLVKSMNIYEVKFYE